MAILIHVGRKVFLVMELKNAFIFGLQICIQSVALIYGLDIRNQKICFIKIPVR